MALIIGAALCLLYFEFFKIDGIKEDARREIRVQWLDAQHKADLEHTKQLAEKQKIISATDAALVVALASRASETSGLSEALAAEKEANAKAEKTGAATSCPTMPDSVRDALNSIRDFKR